MAFDWQRWIDRFIAFPDYNDTEAIVSKAVNPAYKIIGAHRLAANEDNARQVVYVDVLDIDNKRKMGAKLEYNSGTDDPLSLLVNRPLDEIVYFPFSDQSSLNIWHSEGEGLLGLKSGYSYFVVFREVDKPQPLVNPGNIQVTINQKWVASLKPDSQGDVTFSVDIK